MMRRWFTPTFPSKYLSLRREPWLQCKKMSVHPFVPVLHSLVALSCMLFLCVQRYLLYLFKKWWRIRRPNIGLHIYQSITGLFPIYSHHQLINWCHTHKTIISLSVLSLVLVSFFVKSPSIGRSIGWCVGPSVMLINSFTGLLVTYFHH